MINKDLANLYGILIGDGCLSRYSRARAIVITCNYYNDQPFFDKIVIPILAKIRKKKVVYKKRSKHGKIEINFSDKELFEYIKSLGFPVGKKKNISIPKIFFDHNLEKDIISGIFATDGSLVITNNNGIMYPRIEFRSISIPLLEQIKQKLESIGMKGGLYPKFTRLQFNGYRNTKIFYKEVGFINPKHQTKYKNWLNEKMSLGGSAG